jgi:hypothetical protein
MNISEEKRNEIIVYEGFLRRASSLPLPFLLKGSFVTRQYFSNPGDRIPNDLDWLYMNPLTGKDETAKALDEWMIQVTETVENDGVQFKSFRENAFWRMIDYAMDDDFPTVNTDLACSLDGVSLYPCQIDVSYNLPVDAPPVPLLYTPLRGKPFTIPYTVPLALQVSWKLHQSLVRTRFKDLFDLMHLVVHADFTPEVLQQSLQALVKECAKDRTNPARLQYLLNGSWDALFHMKEDSPWIMWRYRTAQLPFDDRAESITNPDKLPKSLADFKLQFEDALLTAGFYDLDLRTLHRLK